MKSNLKKQILNFTNRIKKYISMEYDSVYQSKFVKAKNNNLYEFIATYYLGGNNVPDTSRYVVEYLNNLDVK